MTEIRNFFVREWTGAEKNAVNCLLHPFRDVNGFLISPVKKGISFGNNNGTRTEYPEKIRTSRRKR